MNINLNYKIPILILLSHLAVNIYMSYKDIGNDVILFTSWIFWGIITLFFFVLFLIDRNKQPMATPKKGASSVANIFFSLFLSAGNIIVFFLLLPLIETGEAGFDIAMFLMIILFPSTLIIGTILYYRLLQNIGIHFISKLVRLLIAFISILLTMVFVVMVLFR